MKGEFNECHSIENKIKYNTDYYIDEFEIHKFDCPLKLINGDEIQYDNLGNIANKHKYKGGSINEWN